MPKFTYWESLTPEPPNLIGAVEPRIPHTIRTLSSRPPDYIHQRITFNLINPFFCCVIIFFICLYPNIVSISINSSNTCTPTTHTIIKDSITLVRICFDKVFYHSYWFLSWMKLQWIIIINYWKLLN